METIRKKLLDLHSTSMLRKIYASLKMLIIPFEQFSSFLPKEGTIVDVGCGYGYVGNFLNLETNNRTIIGVDIDSKRIAEAQKTIGNRKNIQFVTKDLREMGLQNLDGVIMADVLHHIPTSQHRSVLEDIFGKLKNNGVFVIRETDKRPTLRYFIFNYLLEVLLYMFSEKINFYRSCDLKKLLENVGFKVEKAIPNSKYFIYMTVLFVCRK